MDCRGGCARAWQRKGIPVLLRAKEPALYQKRRADSEVGPYNCQRFGSMRRMKIYWCAEGLRFGMKIWYARSAMSSGEGFVFATRGVFVLAEDEAFVFGMKHSFVCQMSF